MRGFLHPAVQNNPNEVQSKFAGFPRGRRSKLAKEANTTLLKADQWARGGSFAADVGEALERAIAARAAKKK
jgi:hypothetical protein